MAMIKRWYQLGIDKVLGFSVCCFSTTPWYSGRMANSIRGVLHYWITSQSQALLAFCTHDTAFAKRCHCPVCVCVCMCLVYTVATSLQTASSWCVQNIILTKLIRLFCCSISSFACLLVRVDTSRQKHWFLGQKSPSHFVVLLGTWFSRSVSVVLPVILPSPMASDH